MLEATENQVRRVGRGASLLDEKFPNWENQIDLTKLEMCSDTYCILRQLYGLFTSGATRLGLTTEYFWDFDILSHYGFDTRWSNNTGANYLILEALWAEEVQDRLAEN